MKHLYAVEFWHYRHGGETVHVVAENEEEARELAAEQYSGDCSSVDARKVEVEGYKLIIEPQ